MAARFVVSCTTTLKPAERTCSTQFAQQPHVALLYTVITGGGPTTSERAPSAPASVTAATPSITASQVVDRKSTRLNSSHLVISYAVFCLKKKHQALSDTRPTAMY